MKRVGPIFLADLFCELHKELLQLLMGLTDDEWLKPTVAREWQVRDVAAHLLDSDIRRLSFQRDRMPLLSPETNILGYRDLVEFLNRLNAEWVIAAKRMSPRVITDFLEITGKEVCRLFKSLDPFDTALFSVAWAGEESSQNWFDIAREYTEKWHHQQQIREAVGASGLTDRKWLYPVIDTFFRGLPHTYRDQPANDRTSVVFIIEGDAGGKWSLIMETGIWCLYEGSNDKPDCEVFTDQDTAWRLLTKGISVDQAESRIMFKGNSDLGKPFLMMLAVMA